MSDKLSADDRREYFISRPSASAAADTNNKPLESVTDPTLGQLQVSFEQSLKSFSSANVPKGKRKKKRKLGVNGIVRLLALCLCIGIFVFSFVQVLENMRDSAAAKKKNAALFRTDYSAVPSLKSESVIKPSKDILTFLGSDVGGIEILDTETRDHYDELRAIVLNLQNLYNTDTRGCWGYIEVSGTPISDPIMKSKDDAYYLYRWIDGSKDKAGSVYAEERMRDDYDENRNVVIYGHCMTNGTRFRGLKLFFDSANRYSKAQEMEITVVTADKVYIYEYFSGYRAEGDRFTKLYSIYKSDDEYLNFLRSRRALNTISKDVYYDANSKIITLITCTNLSSKPDERYVLHGILKEVYEF